ncbi:MAG: hypothetical protein KDD48_05250, partial [Bdellovibrionales bacterium]|nr:hypothetical protein [Bdellovibrionales bacterium]
MRYWGKYLFVLVCCLGSVSAYSQEHWEYFKAYDAGYLPRRNNAVDYKAFKFYLAYKHYDELLGSFNTFMTEYLKLVGNRIYRNSEPWNLDQDSLNRRQYSEQFNKILDQELTYMESQRRQRSSANTDASPFPEITEREFLISCLSTKVHDMLTPQNYFKILSVYFSHPYSKVLSSEDFTEEMFWEGFWDMTKRAITSDSKVIRQTAYEFFWRHDELDSTNKLLEPFLKKASEWNVDKVRADLMFLDYVFEQYINSDYHISDRGVQYVNWARKHLNLLVQRSIDAKKDYFSLAFRRVAINDNSYSTYIDAVLKLMELNYAQNNALRNDSKFNEVFVGIFLNKLWGYDIRSDGSIALPFGMQRYINNQVISWILKEDYLHDAFEKNVLKLLSSNDASINQASFTLRLLSQINQFPENIYKQFINILGELYSNANSKSMIVSMFQNATIPIDHAFLCHVYRARQWNLWSPTLINEFKNMIVTNSSFADDMKPELQLFLAVFKGNYFENDSQLLLEKWLYENESPIKGQY